MKLLLVHEDLYKLMPKGITHLADRIILIDGEGKSKTIKDRYPEKG